MIVKLVADQGNVFQAALMSEFLAAGLAGLLSGGFIIACGVLRC